MSDVPQTIDDAIGYIDGISRYPWANKSGNGSKWSDFEGVDVTDSVDEAKAQLRAIIEAEIARVIGKDDKPARIPTPLEKQLFIDYRRIDYRNQLRDQQRQRAADAMERMFNIGDEK